MNEKVYLDSIFSKYEQTRELLELKEEIYSNLHESVMRNRKGGMSEEEAFLKAKEELGDLSQILKDFKVKKNKVEQILYYISIVSIIFGIFSAIVSYSDNDSDYSGWLALNILLPFCVVQIGYIIWYKIGKAKKNVWSVLMGGGSTLFLFNIIMGISSRIDYWYKMDGIVYFGLASIALMLTVFSYVKFKKDTTQVI